MKYQLQLSKATKQDLEDIWHSTSERWSVEQANSYYELIEQGINQLTRTPELGRRIDELGGEYRGLKVKSHLVVYQLEGRRIHVLRVLHERMDRRRHVNE